jgi:hypothetical protein
VLDDDGTGEVADIVAIRMDGSDLRVLLVHCKYSSQDFSGSRVEDLYDVCGQTQKSIRWRHYVDDMLARRIKREQRRVQRDQYSGFHVGDGNDLYRLRDEAYRLRPAFTIAIAQPGVSKQVVSQEQLHLPGRHGGVPQRGRRRRLRGLVQRVGTVISSDSGAPVSLASDPALRGLGHEWATTSTMARAE